MASHPAPRTGGFPVWLPVAQTAPMRHCQRERAPGPNSNSQLELQGALSQGPRRRDRTEAPGARVGLLGVAHRQGGVGEGLSQRQEKPVLQGSWRRWGAEMGREAAAGVGGEGGKDCTEKRMDGKLSGQPEPSCPLHLPHDALEAHGASP